MLNWLTYDENYIESLNPVNQKYQIVSSLRFGLTKLFDSAPNEVIIPSEIGLPFLLEVHSPEIANLKINENSPAADINTIQVYIVLTCDINFICLD